MVEILPYQERWPIEFQETAAKLRTDLGNLALRIDHIGSTSVPGLAAKDNIDKQITVAILEPPIKLAMEVLSNTQSEGKPRDHCPATIVASELEWEKWLFLEPAGQRKTNTHIRGYGRANQRYPLLFRDYLKSHTEIAAAYAELKMLLTQHLAAPETDPEVKGPAKDGRKPQTGNLNFRMLNKFT